ncbi:MAG: hypothetical protein Q9M24_07230, partial [Mariprofundaceae bacterium]|nr:hypothetical protein [Mariprofundaceae bacterium]
MGSPILDWQFSGVVKWVGIVCTVVYNTAMKMIYTTDIFDQWLIKLRDKIAVAKIRSRMDRLEMGNAGDVRPVGEGVSEMRI